MKKIIQNPFFPILSGAFYVLIIILYMVLIDADGVMDKDAAIAIILFYIGAAYLLMAYNTKQ